MRSGNAGAGDVGAALILEAPDGYATEPARGVMRSKLIGTCSACGSERDLSGSTAVAADAG